MSENICRVLAGSNRERANRQAVLNKRARHFSSHSCICRLSSRLSPTVRDVLYDCCTVLVRLHAHVRARALIVQICSGQHLRENEMIYGKRHHCVATSPIEPSLTLTLNRYRIRPILENTTKNVSLIITV